MHPYPPGHASSFIEEDLRILRNLCAVEELSIAPYQGTLFYDSLLRKPLWSAVKRNDLVFAWFGACTPAIILARMLGKPSIMVGGGGDVAEVPSIGYGLSGRSRWWRQSVTLGFRLADRSLLFSDASRRSLSLLFGRLDDRWETLYLSVDTDHFTPSGPKHNQVLSVAYITRMNMRRKGIQTLLDAARLTPEIPYRLVGKPVDLDVVQEINQSAPPNFKYVGYLDAGQLLSEYRRSRVYAQLSMHEGFGMALAEAMGCECVPVVTNEGSIPEVVGDTGRYVPMEDPVATADAIRGVVRSEKGRAGQLARQRVLNRFTVSKRQAGLLAAITGVMPP